MAYTGPSIVDYLKSTGGASDFASRTALATQKGIKNYTGTAEQNTQLLGLLRTPTPAPVAPTPIVPTVAPTPYAGGLAPADPSNKFNTATGQANPAYVDPQQSIIQANLAEQNRLTAEANANQTQDYSIIKSTLGNIVDESNASKITKAILASYEANNAKPTALKLADTLTAKRTELGVGTLETSLASVDQEIAQLEADMSSALPREEGRQVSMTQIGRRESKIEQQYSRAKRDLEVKKQGVVNQLNQKYAVLDTFMKYTGQDIENAQQDYNTKFSQVISMVNLVKGIEEADKTDADRKIDNARANATLMLNALKDKNVSWDSLDATTKTDITVAELSAGLPHGSLQFILSTVKEPVISLGTEFTDAQGNRQLPVITKDPKMGVKVTTMRIGTGKVDTTIAKDAEESIINNILNFGGTADGKTFARRGKDGYADWNAYVALYSDASDKAEFLKKYPPEIHINPSNIDNEEIPQVIRNKLGY